MKKEVVFIWENPKDDSFFFGAHWLKSVIEFNDSKHCKYCLIGDDCKDLPKKPEANKEYAIKLQEYPALIPPYTHKGEIIHYYCYLSPYGYNKHIHIPFIYKKDSECRVSANNNGGELVFKNAEFLPFSKEKALKLYPHLDCYYTSCRNFQFGVDYFK